MDAKSWFGPYRLIRPLDPARLGPAMTARRWAAVHDQGHTGHLIYSLGMVRDRFGIKRFLAAAELLAPLRHPHILPIDAYSLSDKLGAVIVAPYPGHHAGVLTLAQLIDQKGGRLPAPEVRRATTHLLEGLVAAHAIGIADTALGLDRIQVDPRGSLLIELPGLYRALRRSPGTFEEAARKDVLAIVTMARQMLMGPANRLPDDPRWRSWLAQGLDPIEGFATTTDALRALPAQSAPPAPPPKPGIVKTLFDRIRSALPLL